MTKDTHLYLPSQPPSPNHLSPLQPQPVHSSSPTSTPTLTPRGNLQILPLSLPSTLFAKLGGILSLPCPSRPYPYPCLNDNKEQTRLPPIYVFSSVLQIIGLLSSTSLGFCFDPERRPRMRPSLLPAALAIATFFQSSKPALANKVAERQCVPAISPRVPSGPV